MAYFKKREFKSAATYFGKVISQDPKDVQAHYLSGISNFLMDDFSAAIAAFEPIADRERDDLEYLFMLGVSYGILKDAENSRLVCSSGLSKPEAIRHICISCSGKPILP